MSYEPRTRGAGLARWLRPCVPRVVVVQRTSSFLSKRNGNTRRTGSITLTKEPFNLTGKNTFKDSGLANSRAVGIRVRR